MQTNSQKSARLLSAASRGDLETVKEYIEHDATLLYTKDDESQGLFPGFTCLHWAARNGHVDVAKYVLNQAGRQGDPIVNDEDQEKDTAMHVAVSWGQIEMAEILFANGGSLTAKNKNGKTPLDLANHAGFRIFLQRMASQAGAGKEQSSDKRELKPLRTK